MDPFTELLLEFVLQIVFEVIANAADRNLSGSSHSAAKPWQIAVTSIIVGVVAGGVSLLVFPNSFIRSESLRLVNLFASPVALGLSMMAIAHYRKRDKGDAPLDHFGYAFLFAICMALVRYLGTK